MRRDQFDYLEVAHVVSISLMIPLKGKSQLLAISILDMFDYDIAASIGGSKIDTLQNAMTLCKELHASFGDFKLFFDDDLDENGSTTPHIYTVTSFDKVISSVHQLSKRVNFSESKHTEIDPPSPRLLAIHGAIAKVLRLSGAGEYIDQILHDVKREQLKLMAPQTSEG